MEKDELHQGNQLMLEIEHYKSELEKLDVEHTELALYNQKGEIFRNYNKIDNTELAVSFITEILILIDTYKAKYKEKINQLETEFKNL